LVHWEGVDSEVVLRCASPLCVE